MTFSDIDAERLARSMLEEAKRRGQPLVLPTSLALVARYYAYVEGVHFVESRNLPSFDESGTFDEKTAEKLKDWPERAGLERGVIDGVRFK